jgi:8-oxo-dGTP pyrophosphatase MutT (NUDIX family)
VSIRRAACCPELRGTWSDGALWQFVWGTSQGEGLCRRAISAVVLSTQGVALVRSAKRIGWEIPMGRVEPAESISVALHREVGEETGSEVISCHFVGETEVTPPLMSDSTRWRMPLFLVYAEGSDRRALPADILARTIVPFDELERLDQLVSREFPAALLRAALASRSTVIPERARSLVQRWVDMTSPR